MAKKKVILASKPPMTLAEFASMGGRARAKSLSAKRRKEIAALASRARWKKDEKG